MLFVKKVHNVEQRDGSTLVRLDLPICVNLGVKTPAEMN